MDLLNATGETLRWMFDSVLYEFQAGELAQVKDEAGSHLLIHLGPRGLQEVHYGDDPKEIGLKAVSTVMAFHRAQLADHEEANRKQAESDFKKLPKSDAVMHAERALEVYGPIYDELIEKATETEKAEAQKTIADGMAKVFRGIDLPSLSDRSVEDLKETLEKLGGHAGRLSKKKLIAEIAKLSSAAKAGLEPGPAGTEE